MSESTGLPAGWYLNPAKGQEQYWDGGNWLDIPKPNSSSSHSSFLSQPETSTLSIIALILAFFIPIAGFILGFSARKEIDRSNGRKTGRGLATASIWLGGLGTIGIIVLVTLMIIGANGSSIDSSSSDNGTYNGSCETALLQMGFYDKGTNCNP